MVTEEEQKLLKVWGKEEHVRLSPKYAVYFRIRPRIGFAIAEPVAPNTDPWDRVSSALR
jgi:hypothetical protein